MKQKAIWSNDYLFKIILHCVAIAKRCLFKHTKHKKNITDRISINTIPSGQQTCFVCQKYYATVSFFYDDWKSVLFSDETAIRKFYFHRPLVRKLPGKRYSIKYSRCSVKHSPSMIIWGCIATNGWGGLWFVLKNSTINSNVYQEILHQKFSTHMETLQCDHFFQVCEACHKSKSTSEKSKLECLDSSINFISLILIFGFCITDLRIYKYLLAILTILSFSNIV